MSLKNLNTRRLHADRAMPIRVYNTLSRKKEEFVPLHANRVSMFVCGLTPQDETHMGHAKTYVAFDVVARFLRHRGTTCSTCRTSRTSRTESSRRCRRPDASGGTSSISTSAS